uniref:DUF4592 domain-containing protein n=1 Tax=Cyclopterus lumpus TaxID=8103 RepID=A0A8C3G3L8_CYCLU
MRHVCRFLFVSKQRQIAQGIKFGQRPSSQRKSEGDEGSSDEEEVPPSPLRVLARVETEPATTEPKVTTFLPRVAPPVRSPRSRRVLSPAGTIESINLDSVPQSAPRLDNSAAKHKLSVKPKNQRVSRKHRQFRTGEPPHIFPHSQDLQEVSIPGAVPEDAEEASVSSDDRRRASVESFESFKKQRLHEEERRETRRRRELEDIKQEEEEKEEAERRRRKSEASREERRRREEEEMRIREEEERRMREEREEEERRRLEEQRMKRRQQQEEEEEEEAEEAAGRKRRKERKRRKRRS